MTRQVVGHVNYETIDKYNPPRRPCREVLSNSLLIPLFELGLGLVAVSWRNQLRSAHERLCNSNVVFIRNMYACHKSRISVEEAYDPF